MTIQTTAQEDMSDRQLPLLAMHAFIDPAPNRARHSQTSMFAIEEVLSISHHARICWKPDRISSGNSMNSDPRPTSAYVPNETLPKESDILFDLTPALDILGTRPYRHHRHRAPLSNGEQNFGVMWPIEDLAWSCVGLGIRNRITTG